MAMVIEVTLPPSIRSKAIRLPPSSVMAIHMGTPISSALARAPSRRMPASARSSRFTVIMKWSSSGGLGRAARGMQKRFGIARGLLGPLEDQVMRRAKGHTVEARRHRRVRRTMRVLRIHLGRHAPQRGLDLFGGADAMQQPVGQILRGNPQGRAILYKGHIVDIRHFRAANTLIDPPHD